MSTSRVILLQKAVKNISLDSNFRNRWTIAISLGEALSVRYKLENIIITKSIISRAIGKIDPSITNLTAKHQSGIYYRGTNSMEKCYFFQDATMDPTIFQSIRNNDEVMDNIRFFERVEMDSYISRIIQYQSRQHYNKKRKLDEVDMMDQQ